MLCPNCQKPLSSLTAHSHYDAHIEINQCLNCGGLWFDGTELYAVKQGLAAVIEKVDREKLMTMTMTAAKLFCPRDNAVLNLFKDPSFPRTIQVESCPSCQGLWFNRGEFRDWQSARAEKEKAVNSASEKEFDSQIVGLLALYGTGNNDDSLGRLGNFLAEAYGLPTVKLPDKETAGIEKMARLVAMVKDLMALVRPAPSQPTPVKNHEKELVEARFLYTTIKFLAAVLTAYFIFTEAKNSLHVKFFYYEIDIYIWYFRMLLTFFILPIFYFFKFLNYFQANYFPGVGKHSISSSFLQAKMFYYVVYFLLLVLILLRSFN